MKIMKKIFRYINVRSFNVFLVVNDDMCTYVYNIICLSALGVSELVVLQLQRDCCNAVTLNPFICSALQF